MKLAHRESIVEKTFPSTQSPEVEIMTATYWKWGMAVGILLLLFLLIFWSPQERLPSSPSEKTPVQIDSKGSLPTATPQARHTDRAAPCCPSEDAKRDGSREEQLFEECSELLSAAALDGVANPNTSHLEECYGATPLHYAYKNEIIRNLIDSGADPNSTDRSTGWTPLLSLAVKSGRSDPIPADIEEKSPGFSDLSRIQALLAGGANPNVQDYSGNTPLHMLAENRADPELVKTLLEAGADVTITNQAGHDPLGAMRARMSPAAQRYKNMKLFGADVMGQANPREASREILASLEREAEIERLLIEAHPRFRVIFEEAKEKRRIINDLQQTGT